MVMRISPHHSAIYGHFHVIEPRWQDNDVYGHVNNAIYYQYFDSVVNHFLIAKGMLCIGKSEIIGLVVETGCSYFTPFSFPEKIKVGLRVADIGTSSVRYELALFDCVAARSKARAQGHFVHVYVDEKTRRPVPLKDAMCNVLQALHV